MTLIAAVLPPGGPPFFLSDVLVSSTRISSGRVAGPSGLIQRSGPDAAYSPYSLEQKCLILSDRVWTAYCGDVVAGKSALNRLRTELSGTEPSLARLEEILRELETDLAERNSSLLAAVIEPDLSLHWRFAGAGAPRQNTLSDGTILIADGTGRDGFVDVLSNIIGTTVAPNPTYHVLAFLSEVSSSESINAAFNDHFGAIVEVTSVVDGTFQKMPSLTVATEIVKIEGDTAAIISGNYLNYRYVDNILVYRRFGSIRGDEMAVAFGTDYIAGAIYPPGRRRRAEEEAALCRQLVANAIFNDSAMQAISWNDPTNLSKRKLDLVPGIRAE
jgi:hypothetical protein